MNRERTDAGLRIQLEGQLEVVEAEVAAWRRAVSGLEDSQWRSDLRWRAVGPPGDAYEDALAALKTKLADEAGEFALLRELPRLKARVRELAAGHLRSFERETPPDTASALDLLDALQREVDSTAVVIEGDHWRALEVNPTSMISLLGLIFSTSYLAGANFEGHPGALVLGIAATLSLAFVMLRAALVRPPTQVVVSADSLRLQVNGQWATVPIADLRSVQLSRRGLEAVLTFELNDPTVVSPGFSFDAVPHRLIAALREKGFAVDLSCMAQPPTTQALRDQRLLEEAIDRWRRVERMLQHRNWVDDGTLLELARERFDEEAAVARCRSDRPLDRQALQRLAAIQKNVRSHAAALLRRRSEVVSPRANVQQVVEQLGRSKWLPVRPSTSTDVTGRATLMTVAAWLLLIIAAALAVGALLLRL